MIHATDRGLWCLRRSAHVVLWPIIENVQLQLAVPAVQTTAAANANKPTVAWISHFVFAPDEYYQISFAAYKVQYTQVRISKVQIALHRCMPFGLGQRHMVTITLASVVGRPRASPTADDIRQAMWNLVVPSVQDAGGQILSKAAVAAIPGVTVDAFDVTNSTFDFAWNGTQKGFDSQAQARLAFLEALSDVRTPEAPHAHHACELAMSRA
jgi:hypothetical protein